MGTHLASRLRDECKVFTTHFRRPQRISGVTSIPMAAGKQDWIKAVGLTIQPDVIVYLAGARPNAPTAEIELLHSSAPVAILGTLSMLGPKFIYLSPDVVFDGERGDYSPGESPVPNGTLGRATLAAENGVRVRALHFAIIRSAPVFGVGPVRNPSVTDRWIRALSSGGMLELDDEDRRSYSAIHTLIDLLARASVDDSMQGIFHHGGKESCTEFELATRIAERLGLPGERIRPMKKSDGSSPRNYSLTGLEIEPLLLEQGLDLLQKQLLAARS